MESVATVLMVLGYITCAVAGIWLLITAYMDSIVWGLACMFIPFVSIAFIVTHWEVARRPFFVWLGGLVPLVLGTLLGPGTH